MSMLKEKIDEIKSDIKDVFDLDFSFSDTKSVPSLQDSTLTYEKGNIKKGKTIYTCVLFVDIRDSVNLNATHQAKTMGKIYTAFTKSVLKIARYYGAFVRNIIGDRVMVVFPSENCFVNAVDCAISINHISNEINKAINNGDFKCGIGIDYGKMSVIKVGVTVKGDENNENKGLVWVGEPANFASRLTDNANKTITRIFYHIEGSYTTPENLLPNNPFFSNGINKTVHKAVDYDEEDFLHHIFMYNGNLHLREFSRIDRFERKNEEYKYPAILISEKVFQEFKTARPNDKAIKSNWWKLQEHPIRNVSYKVYGATLTWVFS